MRQFETKKAAKLLGVALIGIVGGSLVLFSRAATTSTTPAPAPVTYSGARTGDATFKLFSPAWRGLGGSANQANVQYFTRIFGNMNPSSIPGKSPGTKVYNYTLGPYVTARYVDCSLMPPELPAKIKDNCGSADKLPLDAIARKIDNHAQATYANGFKNNFLLIPDSPATKTYVRNDAAQEIKFNGDASNLYDGIFSDSMGEAPLGGSYLVAKPWFPGSNPSRTYTDSEWLDAQRTMLSEKKAGLPAGKDLIINGLANGDTYYQTVSAGKKFMMDAINGMMAERIFREPHAGINSWDSPDSWLKDVRMIADVQANGKFGYWWTKCWTEGGTMGRQTCKDDGNPAGVTQIRRFSLSSYLLGAGDKSFYNFDQDICDSGGCDDGIPDNAAEWYEGDYTRAMQVGLATSPYAAVGNGSYKRAFSNGLVVVNPTGGALAIALGTNKYKDFDDVERTGTYSVPAHTGIVLRLSGTSGGDTTPPTVSLSSPKDGAVIMGSTTVVGAASDNVGVTKIELLVDGISKGIDPTSPVGITWDSKTVADGSHKLSLKAYDAAGNTKTTAAITITVANTTPPPPPAITALTASPMTIIAGNRSTLHWTTTSTTTCAITPGGPTATSAVSWITPLLNTVGTKTYTLTCTNTTGKTASKSIALTITKAPTPPSKPTLTGSPTTIRKGGSATFAWTSTNATSCKLQPGDYLSSGSSGTRIVTNITATTAYTISCSNAVGTAKSDPVTITVSTTPVPPADPVINSFYAEPSTLDGTGTSTLRWTTSNVRPGGCDLKPSPLSTADANGSWTTPELDSSASYTLTCVNSANKTTHKSLSVIVNGAPAPDSPAPEDDWSEDDFEYNLDDEEFSVTVDTEDGGTAEVTVDNGAVVSTVSGLLTLDPTNLADTEKIANILYVEYYSDDKLITTVTSPPFALDTKLLKNGEHTITERVYYADGSTSEVTKVVDVENKESASGTSGGGTTGETKPRSLIKKIAFYTGIGAISAAVIGAIWLLVSFIRAKRRGEESQVVSLPYDTQDHFFMNEGTPGETPITLHQPDAIITPTFQQNMSDTTPYAPAQPLQTPQPPVEPPTNPPKQPPIGPQNNNLEP